MRSLFQNKNWKWKKENERRWCFFAPSLANTTNNPQHIVYHKNGMFRLQKMENFFFFFFTADQEQIQTATGQLGRAQLVIHQLNMYAVISVALQSTWQWSQVEKRTCTLRHTRFVWYTRLAFLVSIVHQGRRHTQTHAHSGSKCCGCPSRQRCRRYHRQCCRRRCRHRCRRHQTTQQETFQTTWQLLLWGHRQQQKLQVQLQFCSLNALHLTTVHQVADNSRRQLQLKNTLCRVW